MSKKIIYLQYANPAAYPPLEHSSRLLADTGWDVLFIGINAAGMDKFVFAPHERIAVKKCSKSFGGGLLLKLHFAWYCLSALFWTVLWQPQFVYASDIFAAPIALFIKYILRKKVIYHEHDSPSSTSQSIFIHLCMICRRLLAQSADCNVLPNNERIELFCKTAGIEPDKCFCVWNCPSIKEIGQPRGSESKWEFRLLFQGSIVPSRLPISLLQALAKLPEQITLRVIGYETIGHKGYVNSLTSEATRLNINHRIQFLGPIARHELFSWSLNCSVGISFMPMRSNDINMKSMTGASNKPFEYLACGLPLLVSDLPEWRSMFVEKGLALQCDPDASESISEAIYWLFTHAEESRKMGLNGQKLIASEWNYEKQFEPVISFMENILKVKHS